MVQQILVGIVVLSAVTYLVYRFRPKRSIQHGDCNECGKH